MKRFCLAASPGSFIVTAIVGTMQNVDLRQLSNFPNTSKICFNLTLLTSQGKSVQTAATMLAISQVGKFESDLLKTSQGEAWQSLYAGGHEQTSIKFCDFVEQYLHTLWSYHFKLEKFSNLGHSFLSSSVDVYLLNSLYKKFTKTVKGTIALLGHAFEVATLLCKVPGHFL